VLAQIAAEPEHGDVRVRLESLAVDAYDLVSHRLWRSGVVRREESRRLLGRRSVAWIPTDWNASAWTYLRLKTALERGSWLDDVDAFCAGLTRAVGLSGLLLAESTSAAVHFDDRLAALHPSLRDLLAHTEAVLGNSVLTYRS
jgi:hypothetical protein